MVGFQLFPAVVCVSSLKVAPCGAKDSLQAGPIRQATSKYWAELSLELLPRQARPTPPSTGSNLAIIVVVTVLVVASVCVVSTTVSEHGWPWMFHTFLARRKKMKKASSNKMPQKSLNIFVHLSKSTTFHTSQVSISKMSLKNTLKLPIFICLQGAVQTLPQRGPRVRGICFAFRQVCHLAEMEALKPIRSIRLMRSTHQSCPSLLLDLLLFQFLHAFGTFNTFQPEICWPSWPQKYAQLFRLWVPGRSLPA